MKIRCVVLSALFFFLAVYSIPAWEFGFLLSNEFRSENLTRASNQPQNELYERGKFSAWLNFRPIAKTSIYIKGSLDFMNETMLSTGDAWKIAPELDRLMLSLSPVPFFYAELGRVYYRDILGFIADSPQDGVSVRFGGKHHSITAAAYYTGLLYKETAKIILSTEEKTSYYDSSYFAPPHLVLSALYQWSPASLAGSLIELSFIRQMNLHKDTESQSSYALGNLSFALPASHRLNTGGVFSWAEDGETEYGLSAYMNFIMALQNPLLSKLSFELTLFYGNFGDGKAMPVITQKKMGIVYQPVLSRLAILRTQYLATVSSTLSFNCALGGFVRLGTDSMPGYWVYSDFEEEDAPGLLLGEELSLEAVWTPVSDFSLNLGTAFFFPDSGPGGVYKAGAPVKWDIKLSLLLSF